MPTRAPSRALRVLHLEDAELDHELAVAHLCRGGLNVECRRVDTRAAFEAALDRRGGAANRWDLILSDFNVPGFSGLDALRLVREQLDGK